MQITSATAYGSPGVGPGNGAGYAFDPITQLVAASSDANPSPYNVVNNDVFVEVDASNQNVQLILKAASQTRGQRKRIKRSDATYAAANSVQLVTADGSLIEGLASISLTAQNALVEVQSDGTQWQVIDGQNNASWGAVGAIAAVTVTASPFSYTAQAAGFVVISGGTVSAVTLKRGTPAAISVGETAGIVPVSAGDIVAVTYSVLPTMSFVPR
jgi:hypothetical protein